MQRVIFIGKHESEFKQKGIALEHCISQQQQKLSQNVYEAVKLKLCQDPVACSMTRRAEACKVALGPHTKH